MRRQYGPSSGGHTRVPLIVGAPGRRNFERDDNNLQPEPEMEETRC